MKKESHLLVKPKPATNSGIYHSISPKSANWKYLYFAARTMVLGERWEHNTEENAVLTDADELC